MSGRLPGGAARSSQTSISQDDYVRWENGIFLRMAAQGLVSESFDRALAAWPAIPNSGQMHMVGTVLFQGQVVTSLSAMIRAAGVAVTGGWFALYGPSGDRLAMSANTTAPFQTANQILTLPMSSPFTVQNDGLYYVGFLTTVTTTVPEFIGSAFPVAGVMGSIAGNQRRSAQQSGLASPPASATLVDGVSTWLPWIGVS